MRPVRKAARALAATAATSAPALPPEAQAAMARLRRSLDEVNQELLTLLEKRGRLVQEVMQIKREYSLPIYDPERERRMTEALLERSNGVYPRTSLERVFASIFEVSRALGRKE